jgi:xylitol oxidase
MSTHDSDGASPIGEASQANWAGNHTYAAQRLVRPQTVEELQELVARGEHVRALGTRHSFTDIADTTGTLVSLERIPPDPIIEPAQRIVSVGGGASYGALATALEEQGWALASMASLPHISVAGAVATGTHGSGDRNQSLAAAVQAIDIVGPDGQLRSLRRGQPDFAGSVVALGGLGIVTRLELDIEPSYLMRQDVYTGLTWSTLEGRFDDITGSAHSVSLFTRFGDEGIGQMWVKSRSDAQVPVMDFGAVCANRTMHMLDGAPTETVTQQGGVTGPWHERLPHFRLAFIPSRGEELQSEYLLPRPVALEAVARLRKLSPQFARILQTAEIRTVAADDLWLSGSYAHDVVAIHFTWTRNMPALMGVLPSIEKALLPLGARPHWGKVFCASARSLAPLYPRFADFLALRDRFDPQRKFGNNFLQRTLDQRWPDP